MRKEEFKRIMGLYHNKLKEAFGSANVRVAQTESMSSWCNQLFLIKATELKDSILEDTGLIIRIHLKCNKRGSEIWGATSFYGFPNLSLNKETEIATMAGEILESIITGGFVICETGSTKVNITNMRDLSEIFGTRTSHAV